MLKFRKATRRVKAVVRPGITPRSRQEQITLHVELSGVRKQTPKRSAKYGAQRKRPLVGGQASIVLRLDPDVVKWFGSREKHYQVLFNSLLRTDMESRGRRR